MKKINIYKCILPLLAVVFLVLGCSKKAPLFGGSASNEVFGFASASASRSAAGLAYDDSSVQWEGAGYSPEGPGGVEGQTPPVYKDMANLYGRASASIQEKQLESDFERKIVMTANVRVRVENLAETDSYITDIMNKYGAYASSTVIEDESRRYTIRVPSSAYRTAIDDINGMGRVLRQSENAEDVTLRYYDLEGRLATKKELLKTFQSYLGKAKTIEEILSVERRISELQYEIEGTGKELRNLADRVDYATIELTVLGPVASSPYGGPTLGERFRELFSGFGSFLSMLAIILVGIVIFGIPILLLLVFFFWLLFGKIGLLKKLWHKAAGGKPKSV